MGEDNLEVRVATKTREIERALIGLLLKKYDLFHDVADIVRDDHFLNPEYQKIFTEMGYQMGERRHFDTVTIRDAVKVEDTELFENFETATDDKEGGAPEEGDITDRAKHYATRVRDSSYQRSFANTLRIASQRLSDGRLSISDAADEIYRQANTVQRVLHSNHQIRSAGEILQEVFSQVQNVHDRKSRILGTSTGYYELDDMISGLQGGQLYIIAGRPSMGKTSFLCSALENVCLKEQQSALFFSAEMAANVIMQQMLCSHARVDSQLLRSGRISEEEFQKLLLAAGALTEAKLYVNDTILDIDRLVRHARDMKIRDDIKIIAADYLQKFRGSYKPNSSRQEDVDYISREFKNLAKELNIPVVVTAQLNRSPDGREDRKPFLSDLRESGAIEQEADVVMLMYREEYYNPDSELKGVCEVNVAKNRTGPTGSVELAFLKQYTRFENLAMRPTDDYRHSSW